MGHAELEGPDPGSKGEGLTIRITYNGGRGRATVNVPEFLRMRQIRRYRKLMALVRQSDTPEAADEVNGYIRQTSDGMDARMREAAERAVSARSSARALQPEIDRLVARRDRCKRRSEQYEAYSELVKELRQSQRALNGLYRGHEADVKAMQKDRAFYQKIIDEEVERT